MFLDSEGGRSGELVRHLRVRGNHEVRHSPNEELEEVHKVDLRVRRLVQGLSTIPLHTILEGDECRIGTLRDLAFQQVPDDGVLGIRCIAPRLLTPLPSKSRIDP